MQVNKTNSMQFPPSFQVYIKLCDFVNNVVERVESYRGYRRLPPTWVLTRIIRDAVHLDPSYLEIDLSCEHERVAELAKRLESSYVFDGEWRHIMSEIWGVPLHGSSLSNLWDDLYTDLDAIAPRILTEKGFTIISDEKNKTNYVFDNAVSAVQFVLKDWGTLPAEF